MAIRSFIERLESLDANIKGYYCNIVDSVEENEGALLEEQVKLDAMKIE